MGIYLQDAAHTVREDVQGLLKLCSLFKSPRGPSQLYPVDSVGNPLPIRVHEDSLICAGYIHCSPTSVLSSGSFEIATICVDHLLVLVGGQEQWGDESLVRGYRVSRHSNVFGADSTPMGRGGRDLRPREAFSMIYLRRSFDDPDFKNIANSYNVYSMPRSRKVPVWFMADATKRWDYLCWAGRVCTGAIIVCSEGGKAP